MVCGKSRGVGDVKGGGKNVKDRTGSVLFLYPMFLAPQSTEKYKQKKEEKTSPPPKHNKKPVVLISMGTKNAVYFFFEKKQKTI